MYCCSKGSSLLLSSNFQKFKQFSPELSNKPSLWNHRLHHPRTTPQSVSTVRECCFWWPHLPLKVADPKWWHHVTATKSQHFLPEIWKGFSHQLYFINTMGFPAFHPKKILLLILNLQSSSFFLFLKKWIQDWVGYTGKDWLKKI